MEYSLKNKVYKESVTLACL